MIWDVLELLFDTVTGLLFPRRKSGGSGTITVTGVIVALVSVTLFGLMLASILIPNR